MQRTIFSCQIAYLFDIAVGLRWTNIPEGIPDGGGSGDVGQTGSST